MPRGHGHSTLLISLLSLVAREVSLLQEVQAAGGTIPCGRPIPVFELKKII